MSQLETGAARRVRLPYGGSYLAALRCGAADPGAPVVLLLPGFTGSKEDFGPVLEPLAARGVTAVAVDLPGQYESPALPDGADYTPDRLAAVVRSATVGVTSGPVRLLGHSFGGLVARAAVIAEPAGYESLVLLCSGPAALGGARRLRIEALEPVLSAAGLPGVYAAMQAADAADSVAAPPPELADFLERRFLGGSPQMLQSMGNALRTEPDRVAELAGTGLPVLVVHGVDDDAWAPSTQQAMAERLGADYAVLPDSAHSPAVENPAALVDSMMSFWERGVSRRPA